MSFTSTVKDEILNKPVKDKCCKKAFLAGIIRGSGEIFTGDDGLGFDFKVRDESELSVISSYLQLLYGYEVREVRVSEDRLNKKDSFTVTVGEDKAEEILKDLGVLVGDGDELAVSLKFYGKITAKECCLKSFLRGLFLTVGSCTVPTDSKNVNTKYHLELTFSHSATAMDTAKILADNGVNVKITRRKEKYVAYIKSAEEITDFLAFIGTPVSVLKITDLKINGELSNVSNRRTNCDMANVTRQLDAYEKHLLAIDKIEKTTGLGVLKKDLFETAIARKNNPDDTLSELAEKLGVSKSCINHRLRKIVSVAEEL